MKWSMSLKRFSLPVICLAAGTALYAVEPWRLSFNETNSTDRLTWTGNARIVELSDPDRQGVLLLEDSGDQLEVEPAALGLNLQASNFTLSLMFRHDPLPASGEGSDESMVLFRSDCAGASLHRGNDGGNAGIIYATLLTDSGSVLFKPVVRVDDGEWHTLTLRGDSSNNLVQVFVDGVLYPDRDYSGTAMIFSNSLSFTVGSGSNTEVDEIHIFNQALSDADVMNDVYASVCGMGGPADGISRIRICIPAGQPSLCVTYADIFSRHAVRHAFGVQVTVETQYSAAAPAENELVICPGVADADAESRSLFLAAFGSLPDESSPGPEGYALKLVPDGDGVRAWVAGVDERGVLYGLGRLLHLSEKTGPWLHLPSSVDEASAPDTITRGMGFSEHYAMDAAAAAITGAREWSFGEGTVMWEEHLLIGGNTFTHGRGRIPPVNYETYTSSGGADGVGLQRDELCADYGMNYYGPQSVNGIGSQNMQAGWNATNILGELDPHLGCPSVPAARQMIIDLWGIYAKECEKLEVVGLKSADLGGCECATCQSDWPAIFYALCVDITDAIHAWKPNAKVYFTNQAMAADENEILFTLLEQDAGGPLAGYIYAPGGSENSTYGYNVINPLWEQLYPEVDPDSTFLYSRLGYLQPGQDILATPDVTHWKRAGSAVLYPDPVWSETFARRTYNARPLAYETIFKEQIPYAVGMIGYSEGMFDDFNKYLMLRLLWDSELTAEEITREYYTWYCGAEAGALLAEAAFLGEQIMEQPFLVSRGQDIPQFLKWVEQAEACMPVEYRDGNWRFAQMKQKALILQYVMQRYNDLEERYNEAQAVLWSGVSNATPASAIVNALEILDLSEESAAASSGLFFAMLASSAGSVLETPPADLLAAAGELDDEIDEGIAIRELSLTKIATMDEVGVGWLANQLAMIQQEETDADQMAGRLRDVLNYDRVGTNEFYDNCGTIDRQPHYDFSSGELYYGTGSWPADVRPSQRWYNYSFEAQPGLEFSYDGLDTSAVYEVTFTWPRPGQLSFSANSDNEFKIYADGVLLGQVLPPSDVAQYTLEIPWAETADGSVQIQFRKVAGNARCTCISEIWLRKKKVDGLVAHWDFHDNTYNDQVGTLDGSANGAVSIVDSGHSKFAKAIQTGSTKNTDYLNVGNLGALGIYTNSFTVSLWISHASSATTDQFWDSLSGTSSLGYEGMAGSVRANNVSNADKVYMNVGNRSTLTALLKGVPVSDGEWHWLVVRYDAGTGELKYFEDGVHIAGEDEVNSSCSLVKEAGRNLWLGDGFGGKIADVRIYDKALSFTTDGSNNLTGGELYEMY